MYWEKDYKLFRVSNIFYYEPYFISLN